jgi:signal transduction histidine kinase
MYIEMKSGTLATTIQSMKRPQRVHDVLIDALRHTERMDYRQRGIPIRLEAEHPEALILCDLNSLRQALTEVLLNAIAFSTPGDEILVTQRAEEQWTSIAVCDQGPGIPEAEWEQVFEPFHQLNRQWFEQQGIGIGLTLAKGVVELHGGRMDVQSRLEQGAQFTITLPLYSADSYD